MAYTDIFTSSALVGGPNAFPNTLVIEKELFGSTSSANETTLARTLFVADNSYIVTNVLERHAVIGSTVGMLVHQVGNSTLTSGYQILQSTVPHTASIDTVNSGYLINSTTYTVLAPGDVLGWLQTPLGNMGPQGSVMITLKRV